MNIYIRYLQVTVRLTNAVLRMLHTYILVHYSYTGHTGDVERGISTKDVAPRERGWAKTTEIVSTMIMPDKGVISPILMIMKPCLCA